MAVINNTVQIRPEPRWPAVVALVGVACLSLALPENLTFGPNWLLLLLVSILLAPYIVTHRMGRHDWSQRFGFSVLGIITTAMLYSLGALIAGLPSHRDTPQQLLRAAVALWISNILVFACWYWRLDAGGPTKRHRRGGRHCGAFLFPQMTMPEHPHWRPRFVDYLFLAFNTSTAFSPTDAPVLSRWAKVMMMLQALIALTTVAILVGRAVNIL
jgi:Protein of unknown function (DUF1345)